jgi:P4 family phage/plasmid primase-like protien
MNSSTQNISDIISFLAKHKVLKGDDMSHTSMGYPSGSYYISYDNTPEFIKLYHEHLETGGNMHLTEKHKNISPVLIDLDFRYKKLSDAVDRVYTQEHLREFLTEYMKCLNEYVEMNDETTIYVLEKEKPTYDTDKDVVKDGIHIMIPNIVTTPTVQFQVRDAVLKSDIISNVFKDCNFINSADDIIDHSVIQKNNWLMYGSSKPNGASYKVTQTFKFDETDQQLHEIEDFKEDNLFLIKELSIRNKTNKTNLKNDKLYEITKLESNLMEEERKKITAHDESNIDNRQNKQPLLYSNVNIDKLLKHIDVKYCDSFNDWFRIANALINSNFNFDSFDKFSKRSDKYSYESVSKLWRQLERAPMETIGFGTIMHYLKESNLTYFNKIQKELKTLNQITEVEKLLSTGHINHSIVSKIFYEGFKWKYQYSNGFWYRLSSGGIFQKLNRDAEVFIAKEMKEYLQGFLTEVQNKTTDDDKRKRLWTAMGQIESNHFKMGCVSEAKQDFMNETLYKELDTKDNLLGFNNGVFDLKTSSFRIGTIHDKISMTTGYNYTDNYNKENFEFIDKMIDGYFKTAETARWFKKHLGSLLVAGNKEEKGYFWVGNGRNGKGTLDGLLINTLGNYYHQLNNEFFTVQKKHAGGPEPEILAMRNKRLCMTHEPEGSQKYLTSKFKTNTGNDPMSAREMYSNNIETFNPSHKTIIQTNHLPEFSDIDDGLLLRLVVINFPFKYCDKNDFDIDNANHRKIDQNLKSKLKGIENDFINYLIQWYGIYVDEGLEDYSPEIKASIDEFRKETDSVKAFIQDALVKTGNEIDKVSTVKMLQYHNNYSKQKLRQQTFGKRLKANDLDIVKSYIDGVQVSALIGYKYNETFLSSIGNENLFQNEEY